jgi:hypothetical protein
MVRLARALYVVWAVLLWNVVFDHVIVVAGREYIHAAAIAFARGLPYVRMDDFMRPAVTRGVWIASATAVLVLAAGFASIARATAGNR